MSVSGVEVPALLQEPHRPAEVLIDPNQLIDYFDMGSCNL